MRCKEVDDFICKDIIKLYEEVQKNPDLASVMNMQKLQTAYDAACEGHLIETYAL